jgi:hypothetical protein
MLPVMGVLPQKFAGVLSYSCSFKAKQLKRGDIVESSSICVVSFDLLFS